MRVTLTFDSGPDPDATPRVLDILARRAITAHFYVLGTHLREPARKLCVERARDEGHLIGNHAFSHDVPLGDDPRPEAVTAEIAATEALLAPMFGREGAPRRFRPFGGGGALGPHLLSPAAVAYLVTHGYSCVLWNSVPRDREDADGWPARALADCEALPHTCLVLHDLPTASVAQLDRFLGALIDRGAELTPDLPMSCVPIVAGRVVGDLAPITRP